MDLQSIFSLISPHLPWIIRIIVAAFVAIWIFRLRRHNRFLNRDNLRLKRLVKRDGMTGLLNRGWFEINFPRFVQRAQESDSWLALIMVDLNDFGRVNKDYGHPVGDQVLCHAAQVLQACCRPGDFIVRYGGEEFMMVLPGATKDAVSRVCRVAEESLRNTPIRVSDDLIVSVTGSIGGITRQGAAVRASLLIEGADRRMRQAKDLKGSGRVTIVSDSVRTTAPVDA